MSTVDILRKTFLTRHPFKALYALLISVYTLLRLPLWLLWYANPSLRQHPKWTFHQALGTQFLKTLVYHYAVVEKRTPLPLTPGAEKDRWVVVFPAPSKYYTGILTKDASVIPKAVGGTWYPTRFSPPSSAPEKLRATAEKHLTGSVVLHFHGGAYVLGDGRTAETGFLANTFLTKTGGAIQYVFSPQYRLASNPGGHFPAALQDAVTCYKYLLDLGIPASKIVLSGDSAGGNLVIALLRYIGDYNKDNDSDEDKLPSPTCAWLWSPWVNIAAQTHGNTVSRNPNYPTDYIDDMFITWGARFYQPAAGVTTADHPYVSPLKHPFRTETPVWVMTGGAEVLRDDDVEFAGAMKEVEGNVVGLWEEPRAPHDICLIGDKVGWGAEMGRCAERAGRFLMEHRRD